MRNKLNILLAAVTAGAAVGSLLGRELWIRHEASRAETAIHDFLVLHSLPGTHEQMFGEPEPKYRDDDDWLDDCF